AFFTDGVQDEILTNLAKVADLKVISRTSVMQYKSGVQRNLREIAQQLGVAHLLEGSVQRAGGKVRVNAQLIDARTDAHQWAENFDRDIADVFAIQSEIAKAIADQLQAKLSPSEKTAIEQKPTSDVTAFDLYNRAKNILLTTSFNANVQSLYFQAVDLLNQAVARDPSFFEAYCQLAYANDNLYFLGNDHTPARLALAEAAIQAAFRLRPNAGEAHLARAQNLYRGYLEYDAALAELEVAGQTLPNDAGVFELKGYIQRRQGKQEQAVRSIADGWLICALAERAAGAAKNAAIAAGANRAFTDEAVNFSLPFVQGVIARMTKDDEKARSAFTVARAEQEKIIQAQPNYGPP